MQSDPNRRGRARSLMRKAARNLFVTIALAQAHAAVYGQSYPDKPVRVVVPFPAGGGADVVMRIVGAKLSQATAQQFVIDNRPGASGLIGAELVAKAPADGYALLLGTASNIAIFPLVMAKVPYDPVGDFAPVSGIATAPLLLATNPSLPVATVQELVTLAKKRPGDILYASNGKGSLSQMATELFCIKAHIDLVHVPYKGGSAAVVDTVAGNVSVTITALPTLMPHIKSRRLRAIAVTGEARTPSMPAIPTVAESGLPGFEVEQWYGLFGPRGLPENVVRSLRKQLEPILVSEDVRVVLARDGSAPRTDGPDALRAFVRSDIAKWKTVVQARKIKLD